MEFEQPGVNLIMVTYGQPEMTTQNIRKIMENTDYPDYDLTVIDNKSLDGTWPAVCEELYRYPNSRGIQHHQNIGYGQACNLGVMVTNKPLIVFMNSDVYPQPEHKDWLSLLVDTLISEDDIAVAAPKLIFPDGTIQNAGVVGTNKDRRMRGWQEKDNGKYDIVDDVLSVCGAVLATKRQLFIQYGGFDGAFFHYFEEEDLCWRYRYDGLRIMFNGNSVMVHEHLGSCKDQQLLQGYANEGQALFNQRWHDWMETDQTMYGEDL